MTSTCPMGFQLTVLLVLFISFPALLGRAHWLSSRAISSRCFAIVIWS